MIRIKNIKLSLDGSEDELRSKAAAILRIPPESILSLRIQKKAVDARLRNGLHFVYCVDLSAERERQLISRVRSADVTLAPFEKYELPRAASLSDNRPVIVGTGPAGLFCALVLARAGVRPIVLERGKPVEERQRDVEDFWRTGILNPSSNVQFGEGGAGTFSDGKLTTGTHDIRLPYILEEFVRAGAPEDILYLSKPHIGTDRLRLVVANMRRELISLGCDIRFEHKLTDMIAENGRISKIRVADPHGEYILETSHLILAIGHSARDTFEMLYHAGVPMRQKNFAVGVRIEHLQSAMDSAQYKRFTAHPALPPSDYKLSCHLENGRSAFSFCVCPGGKVVAASSESGMLVTNGMSEYARDGDTINGGFLVGVGPDDFSTAHPLSGMYFQQKLEHDAFMLGGGDYRAPAQLVGDFLVGRPSARPGTVIPTYRPGVTFTDLSLCLPPFITDTLRSALVQLDKKIAGYACADSVLTGVETRSSSPVRIERGTDLQSGLLGLYPCGEGAGFAGGIMSAAADGIRCAEAVFDQLAIK